MVRIQFVLRCKRKLKSGKHKASFEEEKLWWWYCCKTYQIRLCISPAGSPGRRQWLLRSAASLGDLGSVVCIVPVGSVGAWWSPKGWVLTVAQDPRSGVCYSAVKRARTGRGKCELISCPPSPSGICELNSCVIHSICPAIWPFLTFWTGFLESWDVFIHFCIYSTEHSTQIWRDLRKHKKKRHLPPFFLQWLSQKLLYSFY